MKRILTFEDFVNESSINEARKGKRLPKWPTDEQIKNSFSPLERRSIEELSRNTNATRVVVDINGNSYMANFKRKSKHDWDFRLYLETH